MNQGAAETMLEELSATSKRYSNFVAILIALVSVAGAIIAWRVAVASSNAGSSDTAGLLATTDREDITTQATVSTIGHQTAYAEFVLNNELYKAFKGLGLSERDRADEFLSVANRTADYIPHRYVDRNEQLDVQRDLNEEIARLSVNSDIIPKPYFDASDQARKQAQWLLFDLMWLGFALLSLTLADAIQNAVRYLFLIVGVGVFIAATFAAVLIELISGSM